jgi:hypothetical protein
MKIRFFIFALVVLSVISACKNEPMNEDLTVDIVGTYRGTHTLNLTTDSVVDFSNQVITVEKIDNEHVRVIPINYPDQSPVDSLVLTATLTPTPYFFIRTEGVMLTFDQTNFTEGVVNGTPYLTTGGGDLGEHGRYDRATGNLVFALEVVKNGAATYELFDGQFQ